MQAKYISGRCSVTVCCNPTHLCSTITHICFTTYVHFVIALLLDVACVYFCFQVSPCFITEQRVLSKPIYFRIVHVQIIKLLPQIPPPCLFRALFVACSVFAFCYLLFVICTWLFATRCLLFSACFLLLAACAAVAAAAAGS